MPLKLLGKKSWHVYNADNVARVRRDEAAAEAQEEEEERQRRELESDRRAALLRGEARPDGNDRDEDERRKWRDAARALEADSEQPASETAPRHARSPRRPRKRHGEDDTDFEMRLAKEQREREQDDRRGDRDHHTRRGGDKEPVIVDSAGHIDLFGQAAPSAAHSTPASRLLGPRPGYADGPSMRFADAGGRDGFGTWYTGQAPPKRSFASTRPHNPDRPDRRAPRPPIPTPVGSIGADPLAAMKQATAALRALNEERQRDNDERRLATAALVVEQKADDMPGEKRRRHRHRESEPRYRDDRDRDRDHHHHHRDRSHGDRHRERHDKLDRSRDSRDSSRRHSERDRYSGHRRSRTPTLSHRARSKSP